MASHHTSSLLGSCLARLMFLLLILLSRVSADELFVYESDWFKKIEAPILDTANSLYSYCLSDAPDAEIYSTKPLFMLVFTPDSQESIRFLNDFNKLYFYFVDYYGGS